MARLLDVLGFTDNPFASYVAENEPNIEHYFIRPQYYDSVTDRGNNSRSLILFGARGAGKSATRLAYYKTAWSDKLNGKPAPLTVIFDDYSRILETGIDKVNLGLYVSEIGYLVVEAILLWLAGLDESEREVYTKGLTKEEEANAVELIRTFYLTRPEIVRNSTVTEPLKLLNQAWHKRSAVWMSSRWDSLVALIATIAQGITKQRTEVDIDVRQPLGELFADASANLNNAVYARALLLRFVRFAQTFGFSGVTVLIDKADETSATNNAPATARLLYPLLSSTQLLEIDGLGLLFFLWDLVKDPYSSGSNAIRLDKIANASIRWEESYLRELVSQRLSYFSQGRLNKFGQMCQETVDAEGILGLFIRLSMKSPRELIRVFDTIIREHDDEFASRDVPTLISLETIDKALDKYTADTARRVFERKHIQQIKRLGLPVFINRDLQLEFKINDDTARNRIIAWTNAGIVAQTGSRAAEGGSGGKPAHEYSIIDQRVRRIVERDLSLGEDYEQLEEFFE